MKGLRTFVVARLWTVFTLLAIACAVLSLWLVTPPSILFRPIEWRYSPAERTATFTRVVNSSHALTVRWSHIVYTPDGPSCSSGGTRLYDPRTQVETFDISDGMRRCLDTPGNVAVLSWQPYLWNVIPLRPFTLTVPSGAEIPR
ncbi:MAG: hypothetical protein DI556_09895 [Rhodovulum sulfidophilum]|uniref:Uncharacterized protein n=1 Tax=Rhodovulum sulfidophilum TaxID=35806 RepID=A0A2W5Q4Y7_RHOSU|nr:MAG: hypothetical protein DI556_09895 [Rhodovulum sulfidophilum]